MIVGGCRALCWTTSVLFFAVLLMSLWTATAADARQVSVRPYRLVLLRGDNETGNAKPEVKFRGAVGRRRQHSSAKSAVPIPTPATKQPRDGTTRRDDPELLSTVAFLRAIAKNAKPRVASDIRRATAKLERALAKRRKSRRRHGKRGFRNAPTAIVIRKSGNSTSVPGLRRSKKGPANIDARQADDGYEQPQYDDSDYYYYYTDTYPETPYSEDGYQEGDHAYDDDEYAEYDDAHSDVTYDEAPHDETGNEYPSYHESSYPDESTGHRDESGDAYGHESEPDDHGNHESAYGEHSEHSYSYDDETPGDTYSQEEHPYHELETDDGYQEGHDHSGYEEGSHSDPSYSAHPSDSYEDGYDSGAENDYPAESYPADDSYQQSEYDDASPQQYQPTEEQPTYHENSYQPDYRPTFSQATHEQSEYDQSYPESSSYDEPYASHNKDYDCPSAPGKTTSIFTSAKEVMYSSALVCLFVSSIILQKLLDQFSQNLVER